jgi:hypothetical protein
VKINKTLQNEDGTLHFEGELTQEEADLVIECGLNWLVKEGALPMLIEKPNLMPPAQDVQ